MRETITFPRPYHRPLTSIVLFALLGALMLVLARPGSIHTQPPKGPVTVPAGTTILVQLVSEISSKMPRGARFETRLKEDLRVNGRVVAPAGTAVYGIVTRSEGGKRFGKQALAATLNQFSWKGHLVPIATDTAGLEAKPGGGLVKIGGGTIVGAVLGGGAGAAVGGVIGGAATALGKERHITVAAGRIAEVHLRVTLQLP
jgi:hypothetical protein